MLASQYLFSTLKEIPSDADMASHQLMLRSGMIRKISSGIYSWLPTGIRVLRKAENIIRNEMNKVGALEILMPIAQPKLLWSQSGRLDQYGEELLNTTDRSGKKFILGPTNEEMITHIFQKEISSYKELPLIFYQIQTKFRDEIRPRFGLIRAKEFIMKDAYSFHTDLQSMQKIYEIIRQSYKKIFVKMGLKFSIIKADNGLIGGNISHEFRATTVDDIQDHHDNTSNALYYTKNIKVDQSIQCSIRNNTQNEKMRLVDTSDIHNIYDLVKKFRLSIKKITKTIFVRANNQYTNYPLIALILRGDHDLSIIKAEKLPQVAVPLTVVDEEEVRSIVGIKPISVGLINFPFPLVVDKSVAKMNNFISGANIEGKHFFGINWIRDLPIPKIADLHAINKKNQNEKFLQVKYGIEIGHIFQLGSQYSKKMQVFVQDKKRENKIIMMGCYGIGITRTIASVIEQNHDNYGILWPTSLAPFDIVVLPIDMYKSASVKTVAENIYYQLKIIHRIDVLFDDRKVHPGVMFSDMDLIGIPHQIIIGKKNVSQEKVEYKDRRSGKKQIIEINSVVDFLIKKVLPKDRL